MIDKIQLLKERISKLAKREIFVHHKWFLKYHLELVEKISLELHKRYGEANLDLLLGLIWIHDYGKIMGISEESEVIEKSRSFLIEIGFEEKYVNHVIALLEIFESKMTMDLSDAPIEVKIVSTADAVSHMYGPFYQMYCYENPEMSVEELMESNTRKLEKDWNRKIVLPEVKGELQERYVFLRESFGEIPERILKKRLRIKKF
jgi:hypothetical protein